MASWIMMTCDLSLRRRAVEEARGYTDGVTKPSSRPAPVLAALLALCAGCAIAWMDTRPSWDDTGVTACALALASGVTAFAGVPWWLAALLAAGPLLLAEIAGLGWGAVLVCAVSVAGALAGVPARRAWRRGTA
jgi:hypothetical protein